MKESIVRIEACVIGSGTGIPNPRRRPPALVIRLEGHLLLFDCGAGTIWGLAEAGLDFRDLGLDPKQLEAFLVQEARIASNPGHWFGREGAGFARINIACSRRILTSALETLQQAVSQLTGGK